MIRIRTLALAFVLACAGLSTAEAETKPFETVRELQALQDRMATGDVIAAASHARALERTAVIFARTATSVWAEPRNARALVIFLFSGGNAGIVAEAVPSRAVAAEVRTLFEGAVAYGLADDDKARTLLMPIDARSLPNGLGGRLALVQAILCSEPDKPKAIALLDVARLLEPGTLIEEAALRKELSLIGASGDLDKFGLLSRRYMGAFGRSIYAENYHQLLVATATRVGSHDGKDAVVTLGRVMQSIDRGERRTVYLAIAHEAVLAGRTTMAAYAAREAARLPGGSASDASRAMVYLGAATIFGDGYGDGRKALADAAPVRLDARARLLRESALAVAEMIRREPAAAPTAAGRTAEVAVVDDGERAIARADETLGKATR